MDNSDLQRWRAFDAAAIVQALADYAKADRAFRPTSNQATQRWHVVIEGREYELVTTGPKFYDTRTGEGGGGAVDVVMHLHGCSFRNAVRLLQRLRL